MAGKNSITEPPTLGIVGLGFIWGARSLREYTLKELLVVSAWMWYSGVPGLPTMRPTFMPKGCEPVVVRNLSLEGQVVIHSHPILAVRGLDHLGLYERRILEVLLLHLGGEKLRFLFWELG